MSHTSDEDLAARGGDPSDHAARGGDPSDHAARGGDPPDLAARAGDPSDLAALGGGPPDLAARRRNPWIVWASGAIVYVVAMLHRVLLGVSGSEVADRLGVPVGTLGVFISVGLFTYLAMQIPAGLAADRIGPRRTLAAGLVLMAVGEGMFAVAGGMPMAIAGRALVGIGDALTFINVLRLAQNWFPRHRQTMLTALTGVAGALGQIASTVPLDLALGHLGLATTFLGLAAATAALTALPLLGVRDHPAGAVPVKAEMHEPLVATVRAAWARPATRHGFFAHMGLMAPFLLTTAVWGTPYLEHTQAMTRSTAAGYLLLVVGAFIVSGPIVGLLAARGPRAQAMLVGALGVGMVVAWIVLLLWPGAAVPHDLLVLALVLVGTGGAGSMVAFDIGRHGTPSHAAGSATAVVNCGGFLSASVGALLIGVLVGHGTGADAYRHAMLPVLAIAAIGLAGGVRIALPRLAALSPAPGA